MTTLRIATRNSPLALWQARFVAEQLQQADPACECELVPMTTTGDRWLEGRLSSQGGKGLFVKELEAALLESRADLAVHSLKDVPMQLPPGLVLGAFLSRHNPADALIGASGLEELPQGAVVGTASQRRSMLLLQQRPDLQLKLLRGNVNTRLAKLDAGEYQAIILAASGMERLGFSDRIGSCMPTEQMIPAPGQGILAIETRAEDQALLQRLQSLNDAQAESAARAERALSRALGGSCALPLAGYCTVHADHLQLHAALGMPDGSEVVSASQQASVQERPETLGESVAEQVRADGGASILERLAQPTS